MVCVCCQLVWSISAHTHTAMGTRLECFHRMYLITLLKPKIDTFPSSLSCYSSDSVILDTLAKGHCDILNKFLVINQEFVVFMNKKTQTNVWEDNEDGFISHSRGQRSTSQSHHNVVEKALQASWSGNSIRIWNLVHQKLTGSRSVSTPGSGRTWMENMFLFCTQNSWCTSLLVLCIMSQVDEGDHLVDIDPDNEDIGSCCGISFCSMHWRMCWNAFLCNLHRSSWVKWLALRVSQFWFAARRSSLSLIGGRTWCHDTIYVFSICVLHPLMPALVSSPPTLTDGMQLHHVEKKWAASWLNVLQLQHDEKHQKMVVFWLCLPAVVTLWIVLRWCRCRWVLGLWSLHPVHVNTISQEHLKCGTNVGFCWSKVTVTC